ncbi:hypothetical protein [Pseudoalteromonas peptidolytica]|uniref:Uncharacterized protein n=1 Tax=Pseudoalteromonas peptidolytica F12-50-A1 TaxID=1315280 RepID=A0A8I0MY23_9GAMM|nr:hypothetical protein [Pseudoalteromonas peptidolytica]MBE0347144.1 hypothetical protein [Pseudoalteromonas peptidolytica F12-50-A1]NLR15936.1 hypothetical protein [Pseudoalteromonas peptidolytica]GEK11520.1 hypothetical protein PPE03_37690 [Pseudoalteromonas peptidolytica]
MKNSWYFLLLAILMTIGFSALHYFTDFAYMVHIMALLAIVTFTSRQLVNLQHISVTLFIVTIIEYMLVQYIISLRTSVLPPHFVNFFIFAAHFLLDLMIFVLLKHRVYWSLRFVRLTNPKNWRSVYLTHADPILYGIFFAYMIVDLAAFGENLIRNMDLIFGVSEETSKPFWSWAWVYKNYEILKSILCALVLTTILATAFVERQRPDTPDEELESES